VNQLPDLPQDFEDFCKGGPQLSELYQANEDLYEHLAACTTAVQVFMLVDYSTHLVEYTSYIERECDIAY
jgi:hypothetical protein